MMMMSRILVDPEIAATSSFRVAKSSLSTRLLSWTLSYSMTKFSSWIRRTLSQIFAISWCWRWRRWRRKMMKIAKSFWFSWSMCQTRSSTMSQRQSSRSSPSSTQPYLTSWEILWILSWDKWIQCRATSSVLERSFITWRKPTKTKWFPRTSLTS